MNTLRTILGRLIILIASIALVGGGITARAQILFTDGDFDAQTISSPVGAPWAASGATVTAAAQSIYDNVYPNNGKGASFPTSGADAYSVRGFSAIPASSTDPLYFNVDFRNNDAPSGSGKYTILIAGPGYYAQRTVGFDVRGSTLRASTPAGEPLGEVFLDLQPNTWYNLQVTLDMAAKTYSGVVSSLAGSTVIPSRPFVNTAYSIDRVYTDTSSFGGGWPSHDVDNWALSTTPLNPPIVPPIVPPAFLFTDGDFDAQASGFPVGSPWGPSGGPNTVTANAQSIYDNVYPNNGKGVNFRSTSADDYLVRDFPGSGIPASSTDLLYFNVDFRHNSAQAGDYTIVIAEGASAARRSVAFEVTGTLLYAESSDEIGPIRELILTLQTNTWYNLQVTLDMGAKTYSGTVASQTGSAVITSRPFVKTDRAVSAVYTDSNTGISTSGPWPDHDFDNWALSTTPLNPPVVPGTFVKSTSPSGSAVDKTAAVTVELQDNLAQVVTKSIQLFLNGLAVTPDSITKPASVTTITYDPPGDLPSESTNTVRIVHTDTASVVKTNEFSFFVPGPKVTSISPVGPGIQPNTVVQIKLTDINTQVETNSIQLLFNGSPVTPDSITKPAGVTTVTYDPPGDLPLDSFNTVRIIFSDTSSPPVVKTNEFSFVVSPLQFLFTDGDFDAQTIGSPVGAPWQAGGGQP